VVFDLPETLLARRGGRIVDHHSAGQQRGRIDLGKTPAIDADTALQLPGHLVAEVRPIQPGPAQLLDRPLGPVPRVARRHLTRV
jgi:hypothetical protein